MWTLKRFCTPGGGKGVEKRRHNMQPRGTKVSVASLKHEYLHVSRLFYHPMFTKEENIYSQTQYCLSFSVSLLLTPLILEL